MHKKSLMMAACIVFPRHVYVYIILSHNIWLKWRIGSFRWGNILKTKTLKLIGSRLILIFKWQDIKAVLINDVISHSKSKGNFINITYLEMNALATEKKSSLKKFDSTISVIFCLLLTYEPEYKKSGSKYL